eukprot:SAG11_NODE_26516_length_344_cov_0.636735_1_plen_35_part_01
MIPAAHMDADDADLQPSELVEVSVEECCARPYAIP